MKDTDIAWASGFFDGEGSIAFNSSNSIRLSIGQKVADPLDRFVRIFKLGKVVYRAGRYKNEIYPFYKIAIHGENARLILRLMLPYLTVKKIKALRALNERTTRNRDDDRIQLISLLRSKGHSFTVIGKMLGVSRQRVHQIYSQKPPLLMGKDQQLSYFNYFYK